MSHAPGHIRDAFTEWIEDGTGPEIDGVPVSRRLVIGQLWNCTDIMPSSICDDLDMPLGSNYAQAVRRLEA
jgi:hypothetical protein